MFCSNCGSKLDDDEKFCSVCGTKRKTKNKDKEEIKSNKKENNLSIKKDDSLTDTDINKLKEYLNKVKMLEIRRYACNDMISRATYDIEVTFPNAEYEEQEKYNIKSENNSQKKGLISFLLTFFLGLMFLSLFGQLNSLLFIISFFVWVFLCIFNPMKATKKEKEKIKLQNLRAKEEFMEKNKEIKIHNEDIKNKISILKSKRKEFQEELKETEELLDRLYKLDFIHPKYHYNFIAIVSFLEYFDTGRCDSLQGYTGAYNIFETEVRQNVIISKLDDILESLEQIKQNQFALYCAIKEGNELSKQLLSSNKKIIDNTRIIAENTEITNYLLLYDDYK